MTDKKKEFPKLLLCPKCNGEIPSQGRHRALNIIDSVRENQISVGWILHWMQGSATYDLAIDEISEMKKHDRDALLVSGGILTDEQIEVLKDGK